ncbi:MAG: tyrosine--tRNA ligase [Candidatus Omnitrophota bacterium]|jgi:tyrosyl-tRNA synthetase
MEVAKQLEIIKRGAVEIISEEELVKKLARSQKTGRPLRIKAGFDPTAPDIHLGHTVLLRKLRQFQECGHLVLFLIGDFTARIGDPTGKSQLRKTLSRPEIAKNARTYKKQVGKILDMRRTRIVFNSAWLERMRLSGILGICMHVTVSQMLAREDFRKRIDNKQDVSMLEFMYPILQGYDSVFLKSDVEIGGTDQLFNLLVGRDLQRDFNQEPQVVLTLPLLEGTDGVNKMSKSLGNYIGINEKAPDMFGKAMSISDTLMGKYFTLLTDENLENIKQLHPRDAKLLLAEKLCCQYHGEQTAKAAREEFIRVFSSKAVPKDVPCVKLSAPKALIEIMAENKVTPSKNEARRLIRQGAVDFEGAKITDENFTIDKPGLLKTGPRRFLKIELH